ncbi:ferroxidase [Synchytrium endobioticum]|uniref:ferroxidase n=1 Tax=Synchytrium endobioticum TaxID=286115 RepID=A0A507DSD3_9FUNG|nr:ferroxidase [Synchytrium endobioticum]TPX54162.1 ferroxidase [Synchytrium endobioticum]
MITKHLTKFSRLTRLYTLSTPFTSQRRLYSLETNAERQYHRLSDDYLDKLVEYFEEIGDATNLKGYDIVYTDGVLTLKLGVSGTYVINKQPPNRQIWLSSPTSGPARFEFSSDKKAWVNARTGQPLKELLDRELKLILHQDMDTPI